MIGRCRCSGPGATPAQRRPKKRAWRRLSKLAVAKDGKLLGVIHLKDIVKGGIRERFATMRIMRSRKVEPANNPGPHGFTEVLYAYTSQTGNNGSAFAGLNGNTLFYNVTGAIAMGIGRFWMIIPTMIIAGSLAAKKSVPASAGTFPTTGGLFVGLVVGVIVIVGGLTFFPALALGPIVEQLAINAGTLFASN